MKPSVNDLLSLPGDANNQGVRVRTASDKGVHLDRWVPRGEGFGWLWLTWEELKSRGWTKAGEGGEA